MQGITTFGLGRIAAGSVAAIFCFLSLHSSAKGQAAAPTTRRVTHIVSFDLEMSSTGQPVRHMHKIQTDRGLEFTDNLDGTRQLLNEFNGMQLKLNDHNKTAVVIPARIRKDVVDMPVHLPTEDQKILKLIGTTAAISGTEDLDGRTWQKWTATDPGMKMGSMVVQPSVTTIWVDPKTGEVLKVEVASTEDARFKFSSTYTHFVVDPEIPDGTLSFDVPASYTKIADSEGRGPSQRRGN
jgi:hypothetical protein